MPGLDKNYPVMSQMATLDEHDIRVMAHKRAPHVYKGVQVGVGRGSKPISNFPDVHTLWRPLWGPSRKPKISPETLRDRLQELRGKIHRVTIKVQNGTDSVALRDTIKATREALDPACSEVVVSCFGPGLLKKVQNSGQNADIWQQDLLIFHPDYIRKSVRTHIVRGDLVEEAEVCFPCPSDRYDLDECISEIAFRLADNGHDSQVSRISTQRQLEEAMSAISSVTFGRSARAEEGRLRGLYVDNPHLDFDTPAAQFLGFTATDEES